MTFMTFMTFMTTIKLFFVKKLHIFLRKCRFLKLIYYFCRLLV